MRCLSFVIILCVCMLQPSMLMSPTPGADEWFHVMNFGTVHIGRKENSRSSVGSGQTANICRYGVFSHRVACTVVLVVLSYVRRIQPQAALRLPIY